MKWDLQDISSQQLVKGAMKLATTCALLPFLFLFPDVHASNSIAANSLKLQWISAALLQRNTWMLVYQSSSTGGSSRGFIL